MTRDATLRRRFAVRQGHAGSPATSGGLLEERRILRHAAPPKALQVKFDSVSASTLTPLYFHLPMRHFLIVTTVLACVACGSSTKTSTGRTERETDSVIGQSAVPGAPVVKKALDVQDSSHARVAAQDSAATGQ